MTEKKIINTSKTKKKLSHCNAMNADCDNIVGKDIDFPTTYNVRQWRDCLLCLLTELVVNGHDREDK